MRCYTFNHFMFRDLCKGIQSNHAVVEIPLRYSENVDPDLSLKLTYEDWAKNHKTLIYLNGGDSAGLHNVLQTFDQYEVDSGEHFSYPMPFASFNEDHRTLEGIMTAIAIVVHPHYYCAAAAYRKAESKYDFWNLAPEYRMQLIEKEAKFETVDPDEFLFFKYLEHERNFVEFLSGFPLA